MRLHPRTGLTLAAFGALSACRPTPVPQGSGCLACHEGIERAHPVMYETAPDDESQECVDCHGGDASGSTRAEAHVAIPDNWAEIRGDGLPPAPHGFIRDFAPDQLDQLDPAYLRFINPGDTRVLEDTCARCHPEQSKNMRTSIMNTNAGHYYPSLYLAGILDEPQAQHGSTAIQADDCAGLPAGAACELATIRPADDEEIQAVIDGGSQAQLEEIAYSHYLSKNCNTCHQAGFPRNNSAGLFRSTGCTSCHMVYGELGIYEGGDPTIAKGSPVHPIKHEITSAIPTQQCATCHFQGGRIGLLFQGIREGGFGPNFTPPNAVPIEKTLYGHAPGYYFTDEDSTNQFDETPPDVHFEAGMHCADCHIGSDVHGDGVLWSSSKLQVDLRCEDCHGTVRDAIQEDGQGVFSTQGGRALTQLHRDNTGKVILTGRVDGEAHEVPQVAEILAGGSASANMHAAMGEDDAGWSHTDSLTCDTCHTSYNQQCVGCHVSWDLRLDQTDYQTGTKTTGLTRGSRSGYTLDQVLLGTAPDGRVQSVVASQQTQLAVVGSERFGTGDGEVLMGAKLPDGQGGEKLVGEFRHRDGLEANNGFVPFFQHTTTRFPRRCDACHRLEDTPEEAARVRGVYGFGTGEFMLDAPDGSQIDGLKFLNDDGTPRTTWVHPGTGPVSQERIQRAFDVILSAP